MKLLLVCNIVLDWIAVTPKANDWIIGEDGIIACEYSQEKDLNIKDVVVEWEMNGDRVYYNNNYNNETYSYKHLKGRATHQETSKQIKLIIHETKASDDGTYEAKIQGTRTATCQVNYITRSKLFIYIIHDVLNEDISKPVKSECYYCT